jgi:predicted 3-demethylubiquinone-9 3-methyltransferase (glyoxalase superfamily)
MPRPYTALLFESQAEEAARFYVSIFPNSKVHNVDHYPADAGEMAGQVLAVNYELDGVNYLAINGVPGKPFSEAVSQVVPCKDQAEIDHYWDALIAGGGKPSQCGWLEDQFGFSWQITPENMGELMSGGGDSEKAARCFGAMMKMSKIVIADIENA